MSFQDFGTLIITFINMPMARVILGENSLHLEFYGNSISDKIKEVVQLGVGDKSNFSISIIFR